jgi:hypothetical protein
MGYGPGKLAGVVVVDSAGMPLTTDAGSPFTKPVIAAVRGGFGVP